MEVNNEFEAFSICFFKPQPNLIFPSKFIVAIKSFISPLLPDKSIFLHLFELPEVKAGGCYNMFRGLYILYLNVLCNYENLSLCCS